MRIRLAFTVSSCGNSAPRGECVRVAMESTGVYGLSLALHLQANPHVEVNGDQPASGERLPAGRDEAGKDGQSRCTGHPGLPAPDALCSVESASGWEPLMPGAADRRAAFPARARSCQGDGGKRELPLPGEFRDLESEGRARPRPRFGARHPPRSASHSFWKRPAPDVPTAPPPASTLKKIQRSP